MNACLPVEFQTVLILESMVVDVQPTDGQTKDSLTRAVEYCTYSNVKICTLSPVRIMRCRSDNHQLVGYEGVEYIIVVCDPAGSLLGLASLLVHSAHHAGGWNFLWQLQNIMIYRL